MNLKFIKLMVNALLCLVAFKDFTKKTFKGTSQNNEEANEIIEELYIGLSLYSIRDTIKSISKGLLHSVSIMAISD